MLASSSCGLTSMELRAVDTWYELVNLNSRKDLLCMFEDLQVHRDDGVSSERSVNNMVCGHGIFDFYHR
jgi:hypothetical protein